MKFDALYDTARPYIACFVILKREQHIAMVLRKNTGYMDGYYGLPAGKVEYGETFIEGAIREAKEEAGIDVIPGDLEFAHVAHRHGEKDGLFMDWVDVYFIAKSWEGEPFNAEPEKSQALEWLDLHQLPENIVPPQQAALKKILNNQLYGEFGW